MERNWYLEIFNLNQGGNKKEKSIVLKRRIYYTRIGTRLKQKYVKKKKKRKEELFPNEYDWSKKKFFFEEGEVEFSSKYLG